MSGHPSEALARQALRAALAVCGIATDESRLSHLEALAASLLADGARVNGQVQPESEPFVVTRLAPPGQE